MEGMDQEPEDQLPAEDQREVRELQEEQSRLRSLLGHSGFTYLKEVLESQAASRTDHIILNPLESMDDVLEQEYKKGEAAGILLACRFAEVRLEDLAEQIEDKLKAKRKEGNES